VTDFSTCLLLSHWTLFLRCKNFFDANLTKERLLKMAQRPRSPWSRDIKVVMSREKKKIDEAERR